MLNIITTSELKKQIEGIIASEDRLNELVTIQLVDEVSENSPLNFLIDHEGIKISLDWYQEYPPYLFPKPIPLSDKNLLGILFGFLNNFEKTWDYLHEDKALIIEWDHFVRLLHSEDIDLSEFVNDTLTQGFDSYRFLHNQAIIRHYGYVMPSTNFEEINIFYKDCLKKATDAEHLAFSSKHYAVFLLDHGLLAEAEQVLTIALEKAITDDSKFALQSVLSNVWLQQLSVPYDEKLLEKLKNMLWETVQFYERKDKKAILALLLMDASFIANISNSFTESLGYISRAIQLLDDEGLEELLGSAYIRKGTLLYTWSHNDNPQFYRPALEAYQQALKIFTKENAPGIFADIHHSLGVLYAEMPDENKKRSIWAAMSSGSFKEALSYFTKEKFPYEYAMICNNYGNAMSQFPEMKQADKYDKAIELYKEALEIRTADSMPYERALTLLNYMEAAWLVNQKTEDFDEVLYNDMIIKASEIKTLVSDENLWAEAEKHLSMLENLRR